MIKYILVFIYFTGIHVAFSQSIDPKKLDAEISKLNDRHKYEEAIIKLEDIIVNRKSTSYDRYNAYLQKYLTYKRLFNYSVALSNLELALQVGRLSDRKKEVEARVSIEKVFVNFDLQKYDEVDLLLSKINKDDINFITAETRAFYISVLATMAIRKKDFVNAEKVLDEAIEMLKQDEPKHLPNIYRKKVGLYSDWKKHKKALEAYRLGLYYAEKYNIDFYIIVMYEAVTHYYMDCKDYKNALKYQKKVSETRTKYNAANQSGNLNILESQLLDQRKNLELRNEKNIRTFLIILMIILTVLILVLLKLFKVNKRQRILIEKENDRTRLELQRLTEKGDGKLILEKYTLTPRQIEIINLVRESKTNKEIGSILFISENTVKYHLKAIYDILDIGHRSELK